MLIDVHFSVISISALKENFLLLESGTSAEHLGSSKVSDSELLGPELEASVHEVLSFGDHCVVGVEIEDWDAKQADPGEHVPHHLHDIEVRVDTITQAEEWLVILLLLRFWDLHSHISQNGLSHPISKDGLSLLAVSQEWEDLRDVSGESQGVEISNVHDTLVDLLLGKRIMFL